MERLTCLRRRSKPEYYYDDTGITNPTIEGEAKTSSAEKRQTRLAAGGCEYRARAVAEQYIDYMKRKTGAKTFIKVEEQWVTLREAERGDIPGIRLLIGKEGVHVLYLN